MEVNNKQMKINNERNFWTIAGSERVKQIVIIFRVKSNDISIRFHFSL